MTGKVKICGECGGEEFTAFTKETLLAGGKVEVHNLSGVRCALCGEVDLDDDSHERYGQACDALVLARVDIVM